MDDYVLLPDPITDHIQIQIINKNNLHEMVFIKSLDLEGKTTVIWAAQNSKDLKS